VIKPTAANHEFEFGGINHVAPMNHVALHVPADRFDIQSFYFTDPDGVVLEFACWTKVFSDGEPTNEPRADADRRPRPHLAVPA
jgi:hypothetical protein